MSRINVNGLIGKEIAGCKLIRELGSGSSGVVYLAYQKSLDRNIACKLFSPEDEDGESYVDNLFNEARNAAKLAHPNVVQALDVGTTDDGINYFLMEYADGCSLENIRVETPENITVKFLLDLSIQLASALNYAWEKFQMIHGDIKPGNMLICKNGNQLKLCDLGLARSGSDVQEEAMVTPLYAAPEIIRQYSAADQRSDIYSFGVMLYELICGVAPFTGTLENIIDGHLNQTPPPVLQQNPDLDRELAAFIDRMIAKDPSARPANWKEVRLFLGNLRKKMYDTPAVVATQAVSESASNGPVIIEKSSWTAEMNNSTAGINKKTWLLPAILLGIMLIAVAAIILLVI